MNSLGIAIIFMILVVLSNDRNYTASGEKTLDIPVNLSNTQNNITYEVHATVYGKQTIEQSKVIDTSTQTCPDDIESLCHVPAGTFSFASQSVPVDSKIQACVKDTLSIRISYLSALF
ncbi:MAG: hypothetical protein M3530_09380 [Thermoproteota archaeon]|nr:hypothetical protein [Thermoproteota archaeon]